MTPLSPAHVHWYLWRAAQLPGVHRVVRELDAENRLSHDAWVALQTERLKILLTAADQHVDYYRTRFRSIGLRPSDGDVRERFSELPVLTKEIVRQEHSRLVSTQVDPAELRENATGGSTGTPLKFYQDRSYHVTSAALEISTRRWWGVRPFDRTAYVWGADRDFSELTLRERFYNWRSRTRSLNAFRMNEAELGAFVRMLRKWRPPYLKGYASALEVLARHVEDSGEPFPQFTAICSSAETLWPHQRTLIEDAFRSPLYDFYGSREVNNLAAECPEEGNLHAISTWRLIEIVDDAGAPLPAGEVGQIALTDLSNFAMPFIRYLNEDVAAIASAPCPCGRPSPVIERLLGRTSDLMLAADGDFVHGEFFTHLFYDRDDVAKFQVRQLEPLRLELHLVPVGGGEIGGLELIIAAIRNRMGKDMQIEVRTCNEIPVTASGKHRFTISDLDTKRIQGQTLARRR